MGPTGSRFARQVRTGWAHCCTPVRQARTGWPTAVPLCAKCGPVYPECECQCRAAWNVFKQLAQVAFGDSKREVLWALKLICFAQGNMAESDPNVFNTVLHPTSCSEGCRIGGCSKVSWSPMVKLFRRSTMLKLFRSLSAKFPSAKQGFLGYLGSKAVESIGK